MKRAILSDIHGNLEALEAVLADIDAEGIREIYSLGDVVGYGPNPRECLDLAMGFDLCILGNHDYGAIFDPEGFSSGAERAIFWTRRQLERVEGGNGDVDEKRRRWDFVGELPRCAARDAALYVHGSPRSPLNEYVFPEDVYNLRKIERIFSQIDWQCFQGHTHVPGVFTADGRFLRPAEIGCRYQLDGEKTMVNVGSVGQPRDADWRACYVVVRDREVEFRRVAYPVDQTIEKIYATADLDDFLGDRLREGR